MGMMNVKIPEVKPEDLTGAIKGWPLEVVNLMMLRQYEQRGYSDISEFTWPYSFGFEMSETPEGSDFWESVVYAHDWNTFFKKYPKAEDKKKMDAEYNKFKQSDNGKMIQRMLTEYITNNLTVDADFEQNSGYYASDFEGGEVTVTLKLEGKIIHRTSTDINW